MSETEEAQTTEEAETATVELWYDYESGSLTDVDELPEPDETIEMTIQPASNMLMRSPEHGTDTHLISENPDAIQEGYHFRVQPDRPVKLLVHSCRSVYDEWNDRPVENGLRYKEEWDDQAPFGCRLDGRVILNLMEWDGNR